jgi:oxysterol-binding protein-related protein 3/6/7
MASKQAATSPKPKLDKERLKEKAKDHAKDGASVFGLFKRSQCHSRSLTPQIDAHVTQDNSTNSALPPEPIPEAISAEAHPSTVLHASPEQRVSATLSALKAQYALLLKALQTVSHHDTLSRHEAPALPTTVEEGNDEIEPQKRVPSPSARESKGTSITSLSDEWFDAPDGLGSGAQEFILADEKEDTESRITRTESPLTVYDEIESDSEEEVQVEMLLRGHRQEPTEDGLRFIVRRTELPAGPVGDEGSLFAILKQNVGKVPSIPTFYVADLQLICIMS